MPLLDGSPPFSLGPDDYKRLIFAFIRAVIAVAATFGAAELIPTLKEHANSDLGLLIIAIISAGMPVIFSALQKFFTDTTPKLPIVGIFALTLVLVGGSPAMAWEFTGATAVVANGGIMDFITKDPLMFSIIILGVCLAASKFLKIDVAKWVVPVVTNLLNSLLKPPTTTTPPPNTTNPPPVLPGPLVPENLWTILQQILAMLNQAEAAGDAEGAKALRVMLDRLSKKQP